MTGTVESPPARERQRLRARRGRRRRPVRRFLIVSHRWLSLVLGLVLLAVTSSGALLLYRPEIERLLDHAAYAHADAPATVDLVQARAAVLASHPDFDALSVVAEHGVYRVTDYETAWTVDPATGEILGRVGQSPDVLRFLDNLHECLLTCEDYPGTVSVLVQEVPGTGWLGYEGAQVTYGGLVLLLMGLLLLWLSLSGIWLWLPRPSRWRSSMSVRWKRGRFARDTDLHKVAGMIAIPLLLAWAVTGLSYETELVDKAVYAVTPGGEHTEVEALSKEASGPDVSLAAAVAAATRLHPDAELVSVDVPAKDEPTAAYTMWLADGFDPYGHTPYPGDLGVFVDRHTGVAADFYGFADQSWVQRTWQDWNFPVHTGYVVTGWWRLGWLVLGLSPLLLAVTGVSTWLVRRSSQRARRKRSTTSGHPGLDRAVESGQ